MLCSDTITYYLNRDNEKTDIKYKMNYMKVLEWQREDSSS